MNLQSDYGILRTDKPGITGDAKAYVKFRENGMPVSDEYLTYVIDQLECIGPVEAKRMFGGAGLYCEGLFFALVADDVLYFKVDDSNRADYESAGMGPFQPFPDKPYVMQYYEVPIEALENRENLYDWARKALDVAERKADK